MQQYNLPPPPPTSLFRPGGIDHDASVGAMSWAQRADDAHWRVDGGGEAVDLGFALSRTRSRVALECS
jgi:hypothetical protein